MHFAEPTTCSDSFVSSLGMLLSTLIGPNTYVFVDNNIFNILEALRKTERNK